MNHQLTSTQAFWLGHLHHAFSLGQSLSRYAHEQGLSFAESRSTCASPLAGCRCWFRSSGTEPVRRSGLRALQSPARQDPDQ